MSVAVSVPQLSILSSSSFYILPGGVLKKSLISVGAMTLNKKGGCSKSYRGIKASSSFYLNRFDMAIRLLSSEQLARRFITGSN